MSSAIAAGPAVTSLSAEGPGFSAEAAVQEGGITARLTGIADLNAKQPLDEFLADLHELAFAGRVQQVVVDFRELRFINSSCLKGLVTWICRVHESAPELRYRIALVSSPDMHWQRRSLHALSCLAPDLVTIQS